MILGVTEIGKSRFMFIWTTFNDYCLLSHYFYVRFNLTDVNSLP